VPGGDMERAVHTSDGRALAVQDAGDRAGRVVLVHRGTPCSRHLHGPWVADAAGRGLRLIGYDRPGYGRSTPCPGTASPAARVMSGRSAPRWRPAGWRCGAFRAVGPTRWPARRCCPIWWRLPRRSPRLRPARPGGWTGSRAWKKTTPTVTGCCFPIRKRHAPRWTRTGTRLWLRRPASWPRRSDRSCRLPMRP
jgi:hypothetical protein